MSEEHRDNLPPAIAKQFVQPPTSAPRRLLSTSRAAKHLGIEESAFRAYVAKGLGPASSKPYGRASRYDPVDLDQWNESRDNDK